MCWIKWRLYTAISGGLKAPKPLGKGRSWMDLATGTWSGFNEQKTWTWRLNAQLNRITKTKLKVTERNNKQNQQNSEITAILLMSVAHKMPCNSANFFKPTNAHPWLVFWNFVKQTQSCLFIKHGRTNLYIECPFFTQLFDDVCERMWDKKVSYIIFCYLDVGFNDNGLFFFRKKSAGWIENSVQVNAPIL